MNNIDYTLLIQMFGLILAGGSIIWYQIDKKRNS
jgi:hypothetical protein